MAEAARPSWAGAKAAAEATREARIIDFMVEWIWNYLYCWWYGIKLWTAQSMDGWMDGWMDAHVQLLLAGQAVVLVAAAVVAVAEAVAEAVHAAARSTEEKATRRQTAVNSKTARLCDLSCSTFNQNRLESAHSRAAR
jgi:hypothetical protein